MTERPIIFSAPMVRAILAGTKTQTRRVLRDQPCMLPDFNRGHLSIRVRGAVYQSFSPNFPPVRCPHGQPGDRLWVRETHIDRLASCLYRADANAEEERALTCPGQRWRPPIHMRRFSSRITLEVTSVRVERLQDISHDDAIAEGVHNVEGAPLRDQRLTVPQHLFAHLWESLHGPGSWDANPWVWVVGFQRV